MIGISWRTSQPTALDRARWSAHVDLSSSSLGDSGAKKTTQTWEWQLGKGDYELPSGKHTENCEQSPFAMIVMGKPAINGIFK